MELEKITIRVERKEILNEIRELSPRVHVVRHHIQVDRHLPGNTMPLDRRKGPRRMARVQILLTHDKAQGRQTLRRAANDFDPIPITRSTGPTRHNLEIPT